MSVRLVAQCVDSASLLVDNVARTVHVRAGVVVYVSFVGACTDENVQAAIRGIVGTKIFALLPAGAAPGATRGEAPLGLVESPTSDVLVLPQATLAGKAKGNRMQYHALAPKEEGARLYAAFCAGLRDALRNGAADAGAVDANGVAPADDDPVLGPTRRRVYCGTYGNRQALSLVAHAPFSHFFEF